MDYKNTSESQLNQSLNRPEGAERDTPQLNQAINRLNDARERIGVMIGGVQSINDRLYGSVPTVDSGADKKSPPPIGVVNELAESIERIHEYCSALEAAIDRQVSLV